MRLAENTGHRNLPSVLDRTSSLGYVFITKACIDNRGKNLFNSNISSQYGELWPTSGWDRLVGLGHPSIFQQDCVLASLLHRRCSTEVNQILHDVWPSAGVVHYIYIFRGSCCLVEFYQVQNLLCVQVLHSPILAALQHSTPVFGVIQTLRRWTEVATYMWQGRALAHISSWDYFVL